MRIFKPSWLVTASFAVIAVGAPGAKADYAVLRSGARLHITGYERLENSIRLTVDGGVVEVPSADLVGFEPEDTFQEFVARSSEAEGPYRDLIRAAAIKHGVDEKLIRHVIAAESNFNSRAISMKQALGLMQLMPETAVRYRVVNAFDPGQNIDAGTHYLKDLLAKYRGNLSLVLAAYNAGPEMVERYGGVPPFPETQSYVKRITSALSLADSSPK